jgi:hypothetical protein
MKCEGRRHEKTAIDENLQMDVEIPVLGTLRQTIMQEGGLQSLACSVSEVLSLKDNEPSASFTYYAPP